MCVFNLPLLAQDHSDTRKLVKGFVVDGESYTDLEGVHVLASSGYGAITDKNGFFKIKIHTNDTLTFSRIEYERKELIMTDSLPLNDIVISLKKKTYMLDSVEIKASYMPNDFLLQKKNEPVYIEGITKKINPEKDYKMGFGGAVSSPATALYRAFSKQYQSEKKVYKLKKEKARRNNLERRAYERLDEYMEIYDVPQLSDEEYDELVKYCNMGLQRILNSNDYDMYLWIDDCVKAFLKERDKAN